METIRIGYARCSTDKQDLTAQRCALVDLGVDPERIYTDHGLTGRTRARPGLDQALAAVRAGDTLAVTRATSTRFGNETRLVRSSSGPHSMRIVKSSVGRQRRALHAASMNFRSNVGGESRM